MINAQSFNQSTFWVTVRREGLKLFHLHYHVMMPQNIDQAFFTNFSAEKVFLCAIGFNTKKQASVFCKYFVSYLIDGLIFQYSFSLSQNVFLDCSF